MTSEQESAQHLVDLYNQMFSLVAAAAKHPRMSGAMVQEILDKGKELEAACEEFRLEFYPRRHSIRVGGGHVFAASKTRRSIMYIYPPEASRR